MDDSGGMQNEAKSAAITDDEPKWKTVKPCSKCGHTHICCPECKGTNWFYKAPNGERAPGYTNYCVDCELFVQTREVMDTANNENMEHEKDDGMDRLRDAQQNHEAAFRQCVDGCMSGGNSLGEAWIHTDRLIYMTEIGGVDQSKLPLFAVPLFDAITAGKEKKGVE